MGKRIWGIVFYLLGVLGLLSIFFAGVTAGTHAVLENLQAAPIYELLDGKDDVYLEYRLGPFSYKKHVESPKSNEAKGETK